MEQLKKELGMESDWKDKLMDRFEERAASLKMPEGVRKVFEEELGKLLVLEPAASEANVTSLVDWGNYFIFSDAATHSFYLSLIFLFFFIRFLVVVIHQKSIQSHTLKPN